METKSIADVCKVTLPAHRRADGELVVAQVGDSIPFSIARMFTVRGVKGAIRGSHAHRRCVQFMMCVQGAVEIECKDGQDSARFLLQRPEQGILVPASIWATETYREEAILAVLCDRPYEESDYIHDYEQFLAWRKNVR